MDHPGTPGDHPPTPWLVDSKLALVTADRALGGHDSRGRAPAAAACVAGVAGIAGIGVAVVVGPAVAGRPVVIGWCRRRNLGLLPGLDASHPSASLPWPLFPLPFDTVVMVSLPEPPAVGSGTIGFLVAPVFLGRDGELLGPGCLEIRRLKFVSDIGIVTAERLLRPVERHDPGRGRAAAHQDPVHRRNSVFLRAEIAAATP